ncbi:MAG TPA: CHAT domain-containing protein [Chloroflexaceae bacterium]|nr:CHAT domain-containing protein [Chloroflexaceae bacterium]
METYLDDDALSVVALLAWFDGATLAALLPSGAADALLRGNAVSAVAGRPGAFALRDEARQAARRRLQSAGSRAEKALRRHVFDRLLPLMADGNADAEIHCFDQLAHLFRLHVLRLEWQEISALAARAAAAGPRQERHRRRLTLYLATVAGRNGDYDRAEQLLQQLLSADGLEPQVRLDATLVLGQMLRNRTLYDQALATYAELGRLGRAFGAEVYVGISSFNQSSVYNELEQYEQALELAVESLRIFEASGDEERAAYAAYSIGLNAMYLGRWQLARDQYAVAIAACERLDMEAPLAACYWGQGFLSLLLGDAPTSEAAYRKAIASSTAPGRGEPLAALDAWGELGFLYFTLGRYDEALTCYGEGDALAARMRHEHRLGNHHYLRGRALQALGRDDEAAAAYGAAMRAVEALRGAHQQEEVKIDVLGTAQQVYEAAALHCLARGQGAEAFAAVEQACSRAFLDSLAARAPELFAAFDRPTVALAEVQAALPPDALLLEYYTTGVLPAGEHFYHSLAAKNRTLLEHLLLPATIVLFAITRDGFAAHRLALDPNKLRPKAGDPRPGRHLVRERLLASLYEQLLGPVEGLLAGRRSLFIVPHGPLHYVPFMALRSSAGRHLVAAGGPAVAIAPSATVLVRNCLGRAPAPGAAAALAVGVNGVGEAALRFAEPEARLVARALGGRALTGQAARAEALAAAGRLTTLHIAGHAAFTPDDPLASYLALAGGDRLTARAIMGSAGLGADLVVLSACTGGLSHVVPGDELLGLQRAWLYAGAAAVVCALWEAPDLVTLLVMERFYAALAAGSPPGAALRDAVVAVRALTGRELERTFARWRAAEPELGAPGALPAIPPELAETALYADPIYWAPFMLIGRP